MNCSLNARGSRDTYGSSEFVPVREECKTHERKTSHCIDRDGQVLSLVRVVAHLTDDGRQECAEAVQQDVLTELDEATDVHLRVLNRNLDLCPVEFFAAHVRRPLNLSLAHNLFLFRGEKVRFARVIRQSKPHDNGNHNREDALDNVDPSPARISANAVHMQNSIRQEASKGTGDGCADKEIRYALGLLFSAIDHGQIEIQPGEETSLACTENESGGVEPSYILYESRENGDQRPDHSQARQEKSGSQFLEQNRPRRF